MQSSQKPVGRGGSREKSRYRFAKVALGIPVSRVSNGMVGVHI